MLDSPDCKQWGKDAPSRVIPKPSCAKCDWRIARRFQAWLAETAGDPIVGDPLPMCGLGCAVSIQGGARRTWMRECSPGYTERPGRAQLDAAMLVHAEVSPTLGTSS